jgi:NADH:ubiquinone oxidoreductase subunit
MSLFKEIFAWWTGNTWGTRFHTWRKGVPVGSDDAGNRYYRERNGRRRWVIYNGEAEASKVPPDWHGWLHYTVDTPPTEEAYERREWEKPHRPNMTGTPGAYRPQGSTLGPDPRPARAGGYRPWRPH